MTSSAISPAADISCRKVVAKDMLTISAPASTAFFVARNKLRRVQGVKERLQSRAPGGQAIYATLQLANWRMFLQNLLINVRAGVERSICDLTTAMEIPSRGCD